MEPSPAAGWYVDPGNGQRWRWWDGSMWTGWTSDSTFGDSLSTRERQRRKARVLIGLGAALFLIVSVLGLPPLGFFAVVGASVVAWAIWLRDTIRLPRSNWKQAGKHKALWIVLETASFLLLPPAAPVLGLYYVERVRQAVVAPLRRSVDSAPPGPRVTVERWIGGHWVVVRRLGDDKSANLEPLDQLTPTQPERSLRRDWLMVGVVCLTVVDIVLWLTVP